MSEREMLGSEQLLERLTTLVLEKRGEDLVVLDVRELVEYMDYLVVVTARSERQARAIVEHVVTQLKKDRVLALSKSGLDAGQWICLDLVDVVLHVFTPEMRSHYDLELLWGDAPRIELPTPAQP